VADHDVRPVLDQRYRLTDGLIHLSGVQALVRLPLDVRRADRLAGRSSAAFVSGYEGSPLGGYDLELGRQQALLDEHDVVFRPAVNEELAATAVQGSQLAGTLADARVDGVAGFWYGKSPGVDRASDALRHATLAGTHPAGGALALAGDDPAAKSSTVPGASERLLADLGMPVLYPGDPQEVLDLGLHAVALSRASGLWVGFKIATNVADGVGTVQVHPELVRPVTPVVELDGVPYVHAPHTRMLAPYLADLERTRDGVRLQLALEYARLNGLNPVHGGPGDRIGILAPGKTWYDLRQALRILGLDDAELARRGIRLMQLRMVHPVEPTGLLAFADGLRELVVVEEKRSFVEAAVKDLLYGRPGAPAVSGKRTPDGAELLSPVGELDPDVIAAALAARLLEHGDVPTVAAWRAARERPAPRERVALSLTPVTPRTPYFCSGCPHNTSTRTPDGSLVGVGIGCHTLVMLMRPEMVGELTGLTQMGGEGAQWIGMAPFVGRDHLLQNIGDGTFHHSGSLAVRAAVAAGVNLTYKLLYNSAVAMTGGQQATGVMSVAAITRELTAEGVRRIIVTTGEPETYPTAGMADGVEVWHRDRLVEAQERLAAEPGVTVLIHDQECATELRRKRKRGLAPDPALRVMINERVCEGCGDCGAKSNCLSVQPVGTEFGRKTRIDQSSCNKDYSCLDGDCPSFLAVVPGSGKRKRATAPALSASALPAPPPSALPADGTPHTTRVLGVGGSGVVTLSQILSVAATLAGKQVRALDQTGLAQKGGAVVSDIKICDQPFELAGKAAAGECDLYLGADLLVAADPKNLAVADPARTVAVVSTTEVPTGRMVTDPGSPFPAAQEVRARIDAATRADRALYLDARALSEALLGADQYANLLLVGAAFQRGALPLPAEAIEQAIALNRVSVEPNTQAFRRGRQLVADPAGFEAALAALRGEVPAAGSGPVAGQALPAGAAEAARLVAAPAGSELERLVGIRTADLVGYQDARYARRYAALVEQVRAAEAVAVPGSTDLAEAVARNLHKLMAYKDEYEVARLSLDPAAVAAVRAQFGDGARVSFRLHPPALRALGLTRKLSFGPWSRPVFRLLAALKRLRGGRLDPFGYAHVRRVERALVEEYAGVLEELVAALTPQTHAAAVQVAGLPDLVRGYEQLKLDNVERYRAALAEGLAGLRAPLAVG
jgi:indolepyruvate ferredoxin oxidoreductase